MIKSALIETLHTAQETFGYLENEVLKFIAKRLKLPFSKVLCYFLSLFGDLNLKVNIQL